jgi:hypothetical protein
MGTMKTLSAAVVGVAIALSAQVAAAYVVQIVTAVPLAAEGSAKDTAQIGAVVESAVRDVLAHAIAFTPTVVRVEDARIIGEQLYLVLLVADAEGEVLIEALAAGHPTGSESDLPSGDATGGSVGSGALRM